MTKDTAITVVETAAEVSAASDPKYIVKLSAPYSFEGEPAITEIDLSGLEALSGADLVAATEEMTARQHVALVPDTDPMYLFLLAARAIDKPLAFVLQLPVKAAMSVRSVVSSFLNR